MLLYCLLHKQRGVGEGINTYLWSRQMYVVLHSTLQKHVDLFVLKLKPVWNRAVQIPSAASFTVRTTLQDNNAHLSFLFYPKQIQHRQIRLHFFTTVSDTTHCLHRDWTRYYMVAMWWPANTPLYGQLAERFAFSPFVALGLPGDGESSRISQPFRAECHLLYSIQKHCNLPTMCIRVFCTIVGTNCDGT